jgi:hypothetical protein
MNNTKDLRQAKNSKKYSKTHSKIGATNGAEDRRKNVRKPAFISVRYRIHLRFIRTERVVAYDHRKSDSSNESVFGSM